MSSHTYMHRKQAKEAFRLLGVFDGQRTQCYSVDPYTTQFKCLSTSLTETYCNTIISIIAQS